MPKPIDSAQLESCLKALYRLQTVDELVITIMREIPKLVASDHTSFNEINVQEGRLLGVMDTPVGQMIVDRHREAYERHFSDNPLVEHFMTPGNQSVAKVSDYLDKKSWQSTRIFKDFYSKFGDLHQMVVSVPNSSDVFIGIALNRLGRDFTEDERETLLFLEPYLAQAYANAVEHTRTLGLLDSHRRAMTWLEKGVVEVNEALEPTYISPLAEHYLEEFFPGAWDGALPPDLNGWLQDRMTDTSSGASAPMPSLMIERKTGRLAVSMLPAEGPPSGGGVTLLLESVLLGQSPRPLKDLGLSAREADVLFWLAQGKSNPEIAIILGITATTVKKHFEAIFRKLNVNNRTEAALRAHQFFRGRQP